MLFRHSAIYFVGRLIPALLNLLGLALYTRLMSTAAYGQYALVITSAGIVSGVMFQWVSLGMERYLPDERSSQSALISTAVLTYAALLLFSAVCGMLAFWAVPDGPISQLILLTLTVTWAQAWFDLSQRVANSRFAAVLFGAMGALKAGLALSLGAMFLCWFNFGVPGLVAAQVIGLVVGSMLIKKYWRAISIVHFEWSILRSFLQYGAPRIVSFAMIYVIDASDRYLIGWYMGMTDVGTYAPAYDLAQQSIGMLMGIVHLAAFPLAVKVLSQNNMEAVNAQIRQNGLLLLLISLPATVGIVLLADNITSLMFGGAFLRGSGNIMAIVAVGVFFAGLRSYYFDYSFHLSRQGKGQLVVFGSAALSNIVLNLILIPKLGLEGAAIATVVAFAVSMLVSWYLGHKVFPLPSFHPEIPKVVAATSLMAVVLLLLRGWTGAFGLAGQIFVGMVVYGLALLVMNVAGTRAKLHSTYLSKG